MSEKSISFDDKKISKSNFYKKKKLFNRMMLLDVIGYVKHFDSNKTMSFKVSDNKLLRKCNIIWEKLAIY